MRHQCICRCRHHLHHHRLGTLWRSSGAGVNPFRQRKSQFKVPSNQLIQSSNTFPRVELHSGFFFYSTVHDPNPENAPELPKLHKQNPAPHLTLVSNANLSTTSKSHTPFKASFNARSSFTPTFTFSTSVLFCTRTAACIVHPGSTVVNASLGNGLSNTSSPTSLSARASAACPASEIVGATRVCDSVMITLLWMKRKLSVK